MTPTVGRIVHYFDRVRDGPRAAIVVQVWSDSCVNLTVFPADGGPGFSKTSVCLNDLEASCWWEWPSRHDGKRVAG